MITVAILVNGQPIFARSAVRQLEPDASGKFVYKLDDGSTLLHDYENGAIPLAVSMLKTIKEPKKS